MLKIISTMSIAFCLLFIQQTSAAQLGHKGYLVQLKPLIAQSQFVKLIGEANLKDQIPQLNTLVFKELPKNKKWKLYTQKVEPNWIIQTGSDEEASPEQEIKRLWGLQAIDLLPAWHQTKGSNKVIVAISDTGAFYRHFDLFDNIWKNPGETGIDSEGRDKSKNKIDDDDNGFIDDVYGWNFEVNSNNIMDYHYHGTHVSGTIGAVGRNGVGISGVNWNVSLMITKFLGHDGSGTLAAGIKTILYAADNGARVINCSWGGGGYSEIFREAVQYAAKKNLLIVAAAGNDYVDADKKPMYPAAYPDDNIISVAATMDKFHHLAYFSNYGLNSVDLAAPGYRILSTFNPTYLGHREFFLELSGTSMAAPHVAGVAALILSVRPDLNWKQLKEVLLSSVTKSDELIGKVKTGGTLNASQALSLALAF